jgi:hypothetical protein
VAALPAQHLLPGEGDDIELGEIEILRKRRRGGVADGQALAVGRDEIAVRHAHARGGAVPGEDDIAVEIDGRKIRQFAVSRRYLAHVVELQLLDHVGDPAGRRIPRQPCRRRVRRASTTSPSRRRRCRTPARCRSGSVGHAQNFARQRDRFASLALPAWNGGNGRASTSRSAFGRPTGALRARTRRKTGIGRTHVRRWDIRVIWLSFQIVAPRWGGCPTDGVNPGPIRSQAPLCAAQCQKGRR